MAVQVEQLEVDEDRLVRIVDADIVAQSTENAQFLADDLLLEGFVCVQIDECVLSAKGKWFKGEISGKQSRDEDKRCV